MPTSNNASHIKEKIIFILKTKGPTIPIHIAQETGISMLFASAFLSELLSERTIKMSHMRVGNSPIYFISGQEPQLERFSNYLKSKEKEAFLLIQERKFLKDSEQSPAIRVALREIRDFAIPFKRNNEIIWRYLTSPESDFKKEIKPIEEHEYVEAKPKVFNNTERLISEKIIKDIKIEVVNEDLEETKREKEEEEKPAEEIGIKEEIIIAEKKKPTKEKEDRLKIKLKPTKVSKKRNTPKKEDPFFEKIKEFLSKETIEIVNIERFGKNEILLRIKSEGKEKLLVAYNKKKIEDTDIINANKKASELDLKYLILSMGEPSKKLLNLIESIQNLEKMEKIEK